MNKNPSPYSVLMSVYDKETPENLRQSLESLLVQTCFPDEIVLVKDGPLTPALEKTKEPRVAGPTRH